MSFNLSSSSDLNPLNFLSNVTLQHCWNQSSYCYVTEHTAFNLFAVICTCADWVWTGFSKIL